MPLPPTRNMKVPAIRPKMDNDQDHYHNWRVNERQINELPFYEALVLSQQNSEGTATSEWTTTSSTYVDVGGTPDDPPKLTGAFRRYDTPKTTKLLIKASCMMFQTASDVGVFQFGVRFENSLLGVDHTYDVFQAPINGLSHHVERSGELTVDTEEIPPGEFTVTLRAKRTAGTSTLRVGVFSTYYMRIEEKPLFERPRN